MPQPAPSAQSDTRQADAPPGVDGPVDAPVRGGEVDSRSDGNRISVTVSGELDRESEGHLHNALNSALFREGWDIDVDLSGIDSRACSEEGGDDPRAEVVQLRRAMQTRPTIDQACGILMAAFSLGPDDAWTTLVMASQNTNTKLHRVAQQLVDSVQGEALPKAVQAQLTAAVARLNGPTADQDQGASTST
ncbi:ANTAR domain-containing protein [Streptomyces bluensis]|uniref:ANTAR domain-containing protein n=1 Tax=Streptomyces bluensis TaxID=33897 RepID=UPI00332B9982